MSMMNALKEVYDVIKDEIAPYKPKAAKALEYTLIPLIIAVSSILFGSVCSLIVRSFTDYRPMHNAGYIFWCLVITLVMYGLLHAVRAYQLYSQSGIFNDPKYVVVVEKHEDWLLKVSTGNRALHVLLNALVVSVIFTILDFDLNIQIGSWHTAIDSRAFVLTAIAIYCWGAWYEMSRAIKAWVKCRVHIKNRFGV